MVSNTICFKFYCSILCRQDTQNATEHFVYGSIFWLYIGIAHLSLCTLCISGYLMLNT